MPVSLYTSRLAEKTLLGEKYLFLKLELIEPNKISFDAGQYILLNAPTTPQKKQYSIASAPRLDHAIELLVEILPNGVASGYLNSLSPGAEVTFYAPAGEFAVKSEVENTQDPLVFIATGSGIAPLRSQILDQLRSKETKRPIWLYWGMRHAQELFWLEDLEELKDNFPNFSYHLVLSKAPEEWTLCRGRVTDCLGIHDLPRVPAHYYLCGNPHMIDDVMSVLSQRGVAPEYIHHEKFS